MKAIAAVSAAALASVALVACGSSDNTDTVTEVPPETVTTDTAPATTTEATTTAATTTTKTTAQPSTFRKSCDITNVPNVKNPSVSVDVAASNLVSAQADQASCATVGSVVKTIGKQQAEIPVTTQGYRCNPTVYKQTKVRVNCLFRAADNPGKVVLTWQMSYTG
ncbi:MAG: hypothetical protein ACKOPI_05620 [bacterium]